MSEFHRFEDALCAWRGAARTTARFAAAIAPAMMHVSVGNQCHQVQRWAALQNAALFDDKQTDTMVAQLRRAVRPEA